ncbi:MULTISPECIES: dephospho-CoA kinase [Nocardiopsis]|uniref:Dephospho-CoA kinase n=1 Tax=Nocardiopsis dassonvillei (strain ATCC 23218 / DSM 43111 / CIP 107115 / JCM 7437 / KCTC 9190 / NBRC 14626 / NCTC 10488 / NRRL B-5397 / IMRU 509) TaxID=446468 RepID=D7B0K0_NOCDD|nr:MULTISPECIES: dephospho-CoA kinase [Nocardiopsis]ADH66407.1 dephospho-CoA kinase [Nocardiopsis dassonvillei subsp. dassonvillei DSM 43111]APC34724.1 dephospho-CoA kinase [Nocardiopsis dassonvillei]NKY77854.1 dephospho-CoA kinase [Nocardiopsis dassonvillei]VEI92428.1 Dephospho-CoA kinase [Nocardiopsis dassonvillei]
MLTVGLTGGIGSGKSAVAAELAAYGATVVDADAIAREVVEPGTPGLEAVVAEFGDRVLTPDGRLDRPRLGEIVFADEASLTRLNAIVHPLVGERSAQLMEEAVASGVEVVVYDVPLLVENGLGPLYDLVVVVDAPDAVRVERVTANRGMPREQVEARIRAQADRDTRLAAADLVVDNSGTREELTERVAGLWRELLERAR